MSNKINKELQKIEIPKELHERSKLGVNRAKAEQQKRRFEKFSPLNYNKWISVAGVFGILLAIMIGTSFFNNDGKLQGANFAITAYALSDDSNRVNKNISSEKAVFELSTEDRIGVLTSVSGGGDNFIFSNVMLNITGEHIDSITYTINKGKFVEDVTLTAKERSDSDWLLSEKIYTVYSPSASEISQGIKEIGRTYTVMYNEQDSFPYTLALPHDGNDVIFEDIIIEIIVKHIDGNTEREEIVVTQESDSISLKLN